MNEEGKVLVRCKYVILDTTSHNGNSGSGCLKPRDDDHFDCWGINISCLSKRYIDWTTYLINKRHLEEVNEHE